MIKVEKANAYSALMGAIAGTVITLLAAAFFLGGQWARWEEVRDAHLDGKVINDAIDLTPFANTNNLPNFEDFLLKSDIPDISSLVTTSSLPNFDEFALKSELPDLEPYATIEQMPSIAGLANESDIPDVSAFVRQSSLPDFGEFMTKVDFSTFLTNLGAGATSEPKQFPNSSTRCPEGSAMIGVEFFRATEGDNVGALYTGLASICRKLTR